MFPKPLPTAASAFKQASWKLKHKTKPNSGCRGKNQRRRKMHKYATHRHVYQECKRAPPRNCGLTSMKVVDTSNVHLGTQYLRSLATYSHLTISVNVAVTSWHKEIAASDGLTSTNSGLLSCLPTTSKHLRMSMQSIRNVVFTLQHFLNCNSLHSSAITAELLPCRLLLGLRKLYLFAL